MMRHGAGIGWLICAFVVACGGDGGDASLDEIGPKVTDALCAMSVRCGSTPDAQTCRASQSIDLARVKAAVQAGRLVYHADRGGACVQALGARARLFDGAAALVAARTPGVVHAPASTLDAVADRGLFAADGFHPSPAGYRMWGDSLGAIAATTVATGAAGARPAA